MSPETQDLPSTLEGAGLAATVVLLVLAALLLLAATPYYL